MSLLYNCMILFSKGRNFSYFYELKENMIDWNDSVKVVSVKEINRLLRIHHEADAETYL